MYAPQVLRKLCRLRFLSCTDPRSLSSCSTIASGVPNTSIADCNLLPPCSVSLSQHSDSCKLIAGMQVAAASGRGNRARKGCTALSICSRCHEQPQPVQNKPWRTGAYLKAGKGALRLLHTRLRQAEQHPCTHIPHAGSTPSKNNPCMPARYAGAHLGTREQSTPYKPAPIINPIINQPRHACHACMRLPGHLSTQHLVKEQAWHAFMHARACLGTRVCSSFLWWLPALAASKEQRGYTK